MTPSFIIILLVQVFILLLGLSIGHSIVLYKLRAEENRKRELELSLLEKRSEILMQGKKIAHDLEEVLYKAKVQQEIDDIIRKNQNK
ncbi:MAG: hypothetical protein JW863_13715 [Chitinispirillaceae bacterium]|nr:hypothetical protein [Chitinispirillaceae bacterium]